MGANGHASFKKSEHSTEYETVFLTGIQALVKLPMLQRQLDIAQGLNTAGLISGYRGSPLGAYDQQLWKAKTELEQNDIVFQPGLNEDLAATALWGAQMHAAYGPTKVDGVFGLWYGKGPGVDRTGDVFRTANIIGTSKLGGVLVISGDDHTAQSSMYPHQTDGIFHAASIPVLQPATVAEIIDFGLAGIALSRYSGLWVNLKTIADVVEAASVIEIKTPTPFITPEDQGHDHLLNWDPTIQWPAQRFEFEKRLIDYRLPAVHRWARANQIDKVIYRAAQPKLGIVTVGKAHQDLMQALSDLGLGYADYEQYGLSIYKVGMSWPLETQGLLDFAEGHAELLVVEEKRANVESQIKDAFYHLDPAHRPNISGKVDPQGRPLLAETLEFSPLQVAQALIQRLGHPATLQEKLDQLQPQQCSLHANLTPARTPYFCSGCPHNSSTKTPEGSISGGGIGCHIMALLMPELKTTTFSQMGGEGVQWAGAQPFSQTTHIFQNLGDGTYEHSGILAIRAAVALNTNITFKILYNDAVAMTGGQPAEGNNNPARISRQLSAEGVANIALVSDQPDAWHGDATLADNVTVYHRDELDTVQKKLRDIAGVTAIIYVQICATEKRRRAKRNPETAVTSKAFINARVCEGCGDCSVQSNCIAVEPLDTAFGSKRKINQSSCNTDLSCLKGFCPSFVELEGAVLNKSNGISAKLEQQLMAELQEITPPEIAQQSFNILFAGIGGSGVLTVGALVGRAALFDHKVSNVLDFTGLAQKNGAVLSQVKLANHAQGIYASRIGAHSADLLMAADLVYAGSDDILQRLSKQQSSIVANLDLNPTAAVVQHRDASIDGDAIQNTLQDYCKDDAFYRIPVQQLCNILFGETTYAHVFMLGYAWQKQRIPLSLNALQLAIDEGVLVNQNHRAFNWGRIIAQNEQVIEQLLPRQKHAIADYSLPELQAKYVQELAQYQDEAYAKLYQNLIQRVTERCQTLDIQDNRLLRAVVNQGFRVMAYKDEYEVARLYSSPTFKADLEQQFAHVKKISLWLAPPFFTKLNPATGRPNKIKFGAWILKLMPLLASFKWLRGMMLDPFAHHPERKAERALREDYFNMIDEVLEHLSTSNYETAVTLCQSVAQVRGYGPVKTQALSQYYVERDDLMNKLKRTQRLISLAHPA